MYRNQYAKTSLVVLWLILGLALSSGLASSPHETESSDSIRNPSFQNINDVEDSRFTVSQSTRSGTIDPISIRQSGYQTTQLARGRIETGKDTEGNITIDEGNGWFVNSTEVEVSGLSRLYAANGTFDEGTDPWIPYSYDGGSNTQINYYNSTGGFIVCKNMGDYNPSGGGSYTHSWTSEAGWEQVITNTPESLSFKMEFDFRYVTGPLDPEGDDSFDGDVGVFWQLEDDGYYYPLQNYDSRETWYSISHTWSVDPGLSSFSIYVGLYIGWDDVRVYVNNDYDDDPLGLPDGEENAENITVHIDNVEFTSTTSPSFTDVGLTFHAGSLSAPITGTGTGTALITNPDLWNATPLEYQITASADVIFTYSVTSLFQRYYNSSWTTSLVESGVAYSVSSGSSSDLEFYTYVTEPSGYDDATIDIFYPQDWENTTVLDPLMNDITALCTVSPGSLHIPTSELSRSGWWEINLNSPNYAKNVSVQVYDSTSSTWHEETLFRPSNATRVQAEIGFGGAVPSGGHPVNITWFAPDAAQWALDSVTGMIDGAVNSSSWTFGDANTTAGEWTVDVLWVNGTEIAFESASFDLYHTLEISITYPIIQADYGQVISNLVTLRDAETSEYLLDDSVSIEANWSSTVIAFVQNYAKNWWEADFDTSLLSGGDFIVTVTASRPYFDSNSVEFTVTTFYETTLEVVNAGSIPTEIGRNEAFTAQLDYEFLNGTGVAGAQPVVTFTGPSAGLSWHSFTDNNNGHYSLDIVCDISGTYEVSITLTKPYHYNSTDSFVLIIGETGSELELLNGTADLVLFGDSYRLVVEFRNSTGAGLSGADLEVVTVTPEAGLSHDNFTHLFDGYYEITLSPSAAGTFSIVISASKLNHETQYATFTLTASGIPTLLTSLPSSASISVDQNFTLQLWFQDEAFNNISSGVIVAVNPPSGILVSGFTACGNGLYNFTLTPSLVDSYDILFRATADNYQSSSAAFTLVVTEIQTILEFEGGLGSDSADFSEPYNLTVFFTRPDTGAFVLDANVSWDLSNPEAVNVTLTKLTDRYVLTLMGRQIGTFSLTVIADKTNHRTAVKQFLFEVVEIETYLDGSGPLDALFVGRSYQFGFSFCFDSNSSNIQGAEVIRSGYGASWVMIEETPSGTYTVTLTPMELGDHSVLLDFERIGFSSASFRLSFRVERVPLTIIVNQGLSGLEQMGATLVVTVLETDTGDPVDGLTVSYTVLKDGASSQGPFSMDSTPTAGIYSANLVMPDADGSYSLRIDIEGDHHIYQGEYIRALAPERTLATMMIRTVQQYWPLLVGVAAVVVGLAARRRYRKKRIRENKIAMAVKKRFDGIKSLLGVIVLHKESGLPIYSRILREGLDETVISAFITAVTSFRKEFDIEDSSEEWSLIPISDIVRVVATDKLVCAFITVGRPSEDYRERMIRFAKTVGFIFDEPLSDIPMVVLDHHNKVQFDALFDDILDGALLRTYKIADDKPYKPKSCADERIARRTGETFKLEELASDISACGLEEGRVYKAIMEALENHLLVSADEPSPYTSQLTLPEPAESEA